MIRIALATLVLVYAANTASASTSSAASAPVVNKAPQTPTDAVAAARPNEWQAISPRDLLVMELAPLANGQPRRVVIQLLPAPLSQPWIANIRRLAAARWWDGMSINRVQDNYVAQWGDPDGEDKTRAKPLPSAMNATSERDYTTPVTSAMLRRLTQPFRHDAYADYAGFFAGWPVAGHIGDARTPHRPDAVWPLHCYGAVGVGRDIMPDAGTGAELYTVIGHAPRQLDRNIAVVGRVIEGIAFLSSLPRGTGELGFYKTAAERVPIRSIRLASDMPDRDRPRFEYLDTAGATFAEYWRLRQNRKDSFYITPAGGADICNVPVPVRRMAV